MISALKNVKPREQKENLVIDLSQFTGEEESSISFRQPRAADLFPNPDATKSIRNHFPEFPDSMLFQIILLGKCYLFEAEDAKGTQQPAIDFGNIARSNPDCFFHILSEFLSTYQVNSVDEAVDEAKNDLAE